MNTQTLDQPIAAPRGTSPRLLTDEQMRAFFTDGCLVLKAEVDRETHRKVYARFDEAHRTNGAVHNNAVPAAPELSELFADPVVTGAMVSLLGPTYVLHQHRYIHINTPKSAGGGWHKDSYWGYTRKIRSHRSWWVMIMYYPQDVALENGPTAVLPGRHAHLTREASDEAGALSALGEAGTFTLVHFDQWHRAMPNPSDINRYMGKFQFVRMDTPAYFQKPMWDCRDRAWREPQGERVFPNRTMARNIWNWHAGNSLAVPADHMRAASLGAWLAELSDADPLRRMKAADNIGGLGPAGQDATPALVTALNDVHEPTRLNAAYALAAVGDAALPALENALTTGPENVRWQAVFGMTAMGPAAVPALLRAIQTQGSEKPEVRGFAAYALGEIGQADPSVIGALSRASSDESPFVRISAVEALGMIGRRAGDGVSVLIERLHDAEPEVAYNAGISLARIGPASAEAVDELSHCLRAENRYVIGAAVEALHRIGTPEAIAAVMHYLKAARWCPHTTAESPFFP